MLSTKRTKIGIFVVACVFIVATGIVFTWRPRKAVRPLVIHTIAPAVVTIDMNAGSLPEALMGEPNPLAGDSDLPLLTIPAGVIPASTGQVYKITHVRNQYVVTVWSKKTELPDVYFFDMHWRRLGQLKGIQSRKGKRSVEAYWCPQKKALVGVIMWRESWDISVGLIDPERRTYKQTYLVKRSGCGVVPTTAGLVLSCSDPGSTAAYPRGRHVYEWIDPVDKQRRVIHTEGSDYISHTEPEVECASPDGSMVAFSRMGGGRKSGIWLLGVRSGRCVQVSSEDGQYYYHALLTWSGPRSLSCFCLHGGKRVHFTVSNLPDINQ